jgi:alkylation response protein AidB-like acyl-CoA dehydrogenase
MAVQKDDGFAISGTKTMITGANRANFLLVLTRTSREGKKHQGLTMFIVDAQKDGLKIREMEKLGYKGTGCCEVVFEDVAVSAEDILGGANALNQGWKQLLGTLDVEHLELAACAIGVAQGAFDEALQYAKDREQFGQPISRFQVINHKLADMATQIHQARLTLFHTVWLAEQGKPFALESAMTKYVATEAAKYVALEGLQIHGGYGYMMEYDAQRYVRDSLILPIGGGTSEIQKNVMAGLMGLLK